MALYDNKYWLLSHIRNSFITTDDTGMCESIMSGESKDIKKHLTSNETYAESDDSEDDDDDSHSYNIETDFEFGMCEKSNTAAQLDRVEHKKKSAKMKHVKWEMREKNLSQEYFDELFVMKDIGAIQMGQGDKKKSLLSELIKQSTHLPINPFTEYAKFDGSGQVNIPTKKYRIFITMLPESQRNYPMNVCCIASAKIEELIGLILLQISTMHSEITLKSITNYGLYITEESGEVDCAFPSLDRKECIAKFGFTCLGLVEEKDSGKNVSFENSEVIAIGIHDDFRKKKTLRDTKNEEMRKIHNLELMDAHNKSLEAPFYQSFRVYKVTHKVRGKIEILLGISGEKIEIDPIQQKNSKFNFIKQKAISHHMDTIAWCEITDVKSSNRTCFKIVYSLSFGGSQSNTMDNGIGASSFPPLQSSASFKHYDFEADNSTAIEIVNKINLILNLRSSISRKEYIAANERKNYKRKSFNLGKK